MMNRDRLRLNVLDDGIGLGGIMHLQDIRKAAYGTTKHRAIGGRDAQALADAMCKEGLLRRVSHDTYHITSAGREWYANMKAA